MNDMRMTVLAKTDQLNADDMIGITKTITVTGVKIAPGEQPVSISFEGDNKKPYKPGKSMRRVLVQLWGADANAYVGRSMTLYRDSKVRFGGLDVGGIRISHMSHITSDMTMALTVTKGQKGAFTVKPLKVEALKTDAAMPTLAERVDRTIGFLVQAPTHDKVQKLANKAQPLLADLDESDEDDLKQRLVEAIDGARQRTVNAPMASETPPADEPSPSDNDFPGDRP